MKKINLYRLTEEEREARIQTTYFDVWEIELKDDPIPYGAVSEYRALTHVTPGLHYKGDSVSFTQLHIASEGGKMRKVEFDLGGPVDDSEIPE